MNDLSVEEITKLQADADADLKLFLEMKPKEASTPLEAKLQIPFTDSAEFQQKIDAIQDGMQALSKANAHIQGQIQVISDRQEAETQARIKSDRIMKIEFILTFILATVSAIGSIVAAVVGILTLLR